MDATLNQQIPANTTIMDSGNVSIGSVGSIPSTETPPPGYMSEDGDPMDQNDNLSELVSARFAAGPPVPPSGLAIAVGTVH